MSVRVWVYHGVSHSGSVDDGSVAGLSQWMSAKLFTDCRGPWDYTTPCVGYDHGKSNQLTLPATTWPTWHRRFVDGTR